MFLFSSWICVFYYGFCRFRWFVCLLSCFIGLCLYCAFAIVRFVLLDDEFSGVVWYIGLLFAGLLILCFIWWFVWVLVLLLFAGYACGSLGLWFVYICLVIWFASRFSLLFDWFDNFSFDELLLLVLYCYAVDDLVCCLLFGCFICLLLVLLVCCFLFVWLTKFLLRGVFGTFAFFVCYVHSLIVFGVC